MNMLWLYVLLMNSLAANEPQNFDKETLRSSREYPHTKTTFSKNQKISEKAIRSTKQEAFKKYELQCIGVGAGGDYDSLSLDFYHYTSLQLDEARRLALHCFHFFQKSISREEALSSQNDSVEYSPSIGITIYSVDKNYKHYPDPLICVVRIGSDGLTYRTDDPENEFKYKRTFTETLEEAESKNQAYLEKLRSNQDQ